MSGVPRGFRPEPARRRRPAGRRHRLCRMGPDRHGAPPLARNCHQAHRPHGTPSRHLSTSRGRRPTRRARARCPISRHLLVGASGLVPCWIAVKAEKSRLVTTACGRAELRPTPTADSGRPGVVSAGWGSFRRTRGTGARPQKPGHPGHHPSTRKGVTGRPGTSPASSESADPWRSLGRFPPSAEPDAPSAWLPAIAPDRRQSRVATPAPASGPRGTADRRTAETFRQAGAGGCARRPAQWWGATPRRGQAGMLHGQRRPDRLALCRDRRSGAAVR